MIGALHLLITYQCTSECPHCFVWGGPVGPTMTAQQISEYIEEAIAAGVEKIAFEGGEPFLYHPNLVHGVRTAQSAGLQVTVVTNGFWALSADDARRWLAPMTELGPLGMAISTDEYHGDEE
ncbi:MAG: radical SAM protein, partial [Bacillota bacterium]